MQSSCNVIGQGAFKGAQHVTSELGLLIFFLQLKVEIYLFSLAYKTRFHLIFRLPA